MSRSSGQSDHLTIVKEKQIAVVWSCLPFIRSGQNHLARHSERGKKRRQTEEEMGRQHQGMDRPGVRQVPEGSGEKRKMEETGCEIICGAPMTLAVKRLMMMMIHVHYLLGEALFLCSSVCSVDIRDNFYTSVKKKVTCLFF